jgi:ATPase subunit of ABC transporter with duplicated ATPase domains
MISLVEGFKGWCMRHYTLMSELLMLPDEPTNHFPDLMLFYGLKRDQRHGLVIVISHDQTFWMPLIAFICQSSKRSRDVHG